MYTKILNLDSNLLSPDITRGLPANDCVVIWREYTAACRDHGQKAIIQCSLQLWSTNLVSVRYDTIDVMQFRELCYWIRQSYKNGWAVVPCIIFSFVHLSVNMKDVFDFSPKIVLKVVKSFGFKFIWTVMYCISFRAIEDPLFLTRMCLMQEYLTLLN